MPHFGYNNTAILIHRGFKPQNYHNTPQNLIAESHRHQVVCASLFLFLGKAALLRHRAISLPLIRPLDTNKRRMLLWAAMDHGCPDIVWYSWRMLKLSGSLCFFKAFLSLSHTWTFTFPSTCPTLPYLFSHTLSYKEG